MHTFTSRFARVLLCTFAALCALPAAHTHAAGPVLTLPKTSLQADDVAVVVNIDDGLSRAIGAYYQQRRGIPERNIIRIRFRAGVPNLPAAEFRRLWPKVLAQTPPQVQAYALTWAFPYKVDCMSITSAFATGYDPRYCAARTCATTRQNPYFNSNSTTPYDDFKLRPSMAIAATDLAQARALIERGIAADHTYPKGTGYLLSTSDTARNVRAVQFPAMIDFFRSMVRLRLLKTDYLQNVDDVLFYFTGVVKVEQLATLHFLPGAIADHLTSAGGVLDVTGQMSSLRWLEAGATGSYGTVVEPCNYLQKFPVPGIVIDHYLRGETLIEAYWKSVAWPGEGLFIGEPLANPYGGYSITARDHSITLRTQALVPGRYLLESADAAAGPYRPERNVIISKRELQTIVLNNLTHPYYRLAEVETP